MDPIRGASSSYATALGGLNDAGRRMSAAAESLSSAGGLSPVDSAEFSDAARATSVDSMAGAAIEMREARTQASAMGALVRAQTRMDQETLDLLA